MLNAIHPTKMKAQELSQCFICENDLIVLLLILHINLPSVFYFLVIIKKTQM